LSLDRLCGFKFKAGDISGALATYEELIQREYNNTPQTDASSTG
jgi:hypothetical protein